MNGHWYLYPMQQKPQAFAQHREYSVRVENAYRKIENCHGYESQIWLKGHMMKKIGMECTCCWFLTRDADADANANNRPCMHVTYVLMMWYEALHSQNWTMLGSEAKRAGAIFIACSTIYLLSGALKRFPHKKTRENVVISRKWRRENEKQQQRQQRRRRLCAQIAVAAFQIYINIYTKNEEVFQGVMHLYVFYCII